MGGLCGRVLEPAAWQGSLRGLGQGVTCACDTRFPQHRLGEKRTPWHLRVRCAT